MARCNVEYKGKYAGFSSIVEAFVTQFMSREDYELWRRIEYGENIRDIEFNLQSISEVSYSIRLNRSHDESIECLLESGLTKAEVEEIMYEVESKHYVPRLDSDGIYKCPNCGTATEKNSVECEESNCSREFVWRN